MSTTIIEATVIRWSENQGLAPSTIGRRLSTICGFYTYCAQERLIDRNPAAHVR